eukprot:354346-Chlamydomonas_euryale.AAC.6
MAESTEATRQRLSLHSSPGVGRHTLHRECSHVARVASKTRRNFAVDSESAAAMCAAAHVGRCSLRQGVGNRRGPKVTGRAKLSRDSRNKHRQAQHSSAHRHGDKAPPSSPLPPPLNLNPPCCCNGRHKPVGVAHGDKACAQRAACERLQRAVLPLRQDGGRVAAHSCQRRRREHGAAQPKHKRRLTHQQGVEACVGAEHRRLWQAHHTCPVDRHLCQHLITARDKHERVDVPCHCGPGGRVAEERPDEVNARSAAAFPLSKHHAVPLTFRRDGCKQRRHLGAHLGRRLRGDARRRCTADVANARRHAVHRAGAAVAVMPRGQHALALCALRQPRHRHRHAAPDVHHQHTALTERSMEWAVHSVHRVDRRGGRPR